MTRPELVADAERIAAQCRLLAASGVDATHRDQLAPLLGGIRRFYGHHNGNAVPADITVNPQTGKFTNILDSTGQLCRHVWFDDILCPHCLTAVAASSAVGGMAAKTVLQLYADDLRARTFATTARWWEVTIGGMKLRAYNPLAPELVRESWNDADALHRLFERLKRENVFQLAMDPELGLPKTAQTGNPEMDARLWITDMLMTGFRLKHDDPSLWRYILSFISAFYNTERNIGHVQSAVTNPEWYRSGPITTGLAHVIMVHSMHDGNGKIKLDPETKLPLPGQELEDPGWGNRKRLESVGAALKALCEALLYGALYGESPQGKAWGFIWDEEHAKAFPEGQNTPLHPTAREYIIRTVQLLGSYLLAIQWNGSTYDGLATTCCDWEEAAIGPAARDIAEMKAGLKRLQQLLFSPKYSNNRIIAEIRRSVANVEVGGWAGPMNPVLHDHRYADFRDPANLERVIYALELVFARLITSKAADAVGGQKNAPVRYVANSPQRDADMSTAIMLAVHDDEDEFDGSPARSGGMGFGLLRWIEEELMHPDFTKRFGTVRYNIFGSVQAPVWDGYLGAAWNVTSKAPRLICPLIAQQAGLLYREIERFLPERRRIGTLTMNDVALEAVYRYAAGEGGNTSVRPTTDATTLDGMRQRQCLSIPLWSAQWPLGVAAALVGAAKAKTQLVRRLKDGPPDTMVRFRLWKLNSLISRFLNLMIRTIVSDIDREGKPVIRANGEPMPPGLSVMEAFQAVVKLYDSESPTVREEMAFLPGDHTLGWARAMFFEALIRLTEAAKLEAELGAEPILVDE